MPGRNMEEKARRNAEVGQSGARWRGGKNRAGNHGKSCGLLRALWTRQRTYIRPSDTIRPIVREPLQSTFKGAGRQIAAVDNVVELGAAIEDDRRHTFTPNAGGLGVGIGNSDNLFS
ncbi:hypothetical protein SAMN05216228_100237 [Rhizobium tibeticum]|uniref:Uncharacterized protein n=1 Tax=Rhizobium tibeticum TaxID=501024 RepID=A0A1H8DFB0_9HYPH|nr:hypothetical protein RTCCBAU85039_0858 [Rhizobium tibeticum]SEN05972.1 hypothetical protein SAMN05216228_100237 [Rhizobium tibeticum]